MDVMAERPTLGEYAVTVLRRSMATWHGNEWLFALVTYISVLILGLLATGLVAKIVSDVIQSTLAWTAVGWLFTLLFIITPYRMWHDEKYKLNVIEEASRPRITSDWRVKDGNGEFILTNNSSKSINGVSVTLRNYRKADGTPGGDIMYDMPTTDRRKPPLELYPGDPTYFHFAGLGKTNGNTIIILLPLTDRSLQVGVEVGVKLGFRGTDLTAQPIDLRLKVSDDGLSIESWDEGKKAVGEGGIEA